VDFSNIVIQGTTLASREFPPISLMMVSERLATAKSVGKYRGFHG